MKSRSVLCAVMISMAIVSCGGVGDPAYCTDFYVENSSNYEVTIEEDNRGPSIYNYEATIVSGARAKVGSACDIGGYPYPSEYFEKFSIFRGVSENRVVIYSAVENNDWTFETQSYSEYASRTLIINDEGVIR